MITSKKNFSKQAQKQDCHLFIILLKLNLHFAIDKFYHNIKNVLL